MEKQPLPVESAHYLSLSSPESESVCGYPSISVVWLPASHSQASISLQYDWIAPVISGGMGVAWDSVRGKPSEAYREGGDWDHWGLRLLSRSGLYLLGFLFITYKSFAFY